MQENEALDKNERSAYARSIEPGRLRIDLVSDCVFRMLTRGRITIVAQLADVALIVALATMTLPAAQAASSGAHMRYIICVMAAAAAAHFSFFKSGFYEIDFLMQPLRAIKEMATQWTLIFVILAAAATLAHQPAAYSRLWFLGFYAGGIVALGFERWLIARLIAEWIRRGHHSLSVAIVGHNQLSSLLIEKFRGNSMGIRIVGVFDDRGNKHQDSSNLVAGGIADLLEYSKTHEIDTVIITLPLTATERIQAVIRQLRQLPANLRLLPGGIGLARISPIRLARTELPGVQLIAIADQPISDFALFLKGAFDRITAGFGLFLLSPLLLFCAAGIRFTSEGPIFFKQKRIGFKGREFYIMKFRTMHAATWQRKELTQRGDPRIFKFGGLLRKTSIDELPQLINVLKGDMSLVGPRPHMPEARAAGRLYFDAVEEYANRQRVKPGITGWAQVNGWRGPTETVEQIERRVEHDIYYIENWSLLFDFLIIVKTLLVGFYGKNAY